MHYGDFIDVNDKIIHLLYAANFEGESLYKQAVCECIDMWGSTAIKAVKEFELDYKRN